MSTCGTARESTRGGWNRGKSPPEPGSGSRRRVRPAASGRWEHGTTLRWPGQPPGGEDEVPAAAREITASLFWLGNEPMQVNHAYLLKLATSETEVILSAIPERLNSSPLEGIGRL